MYSMTRLEFDAAAKAVTVRTEQGDHEAGEETVTVVRQVLRDGVFVPAQTD